MNELEPTPPHKTVIAMVAIYREWAFEEAKSPACRAGAEAKGEIMRSLTQSHLRSIPLLITSRNM